MIYLVLLSIIQFILSYHQIRINYVNMKQSYKGNGLFYMYAVFFIASLIPVIGCSIFGAMFLINLSEGNIRFKLPKQFKNVCRVDLVKLMDKIFMVDKERN